MKPLKTLFLYFISSISLAESLPKVFIDKGACPHECCTYRTWDVKKETPLYAGINSTLEIGVLKANTKAEVLTGEVHTIPLRLKDNSGEEFYLLTYDGEGLWKIWKNGKFDTGIEGNWEMKSQPDSTWWLQIKHPNGKIGWTKESGNFEDYLGCDTEEEVTSESVPQDGLTCDFNVTGISDRASFIQFIHDLKKAAQSKNAKLLEKMVLYPIRVNGGKPNPLFIKNTKEFEKNFDNIFTQKLLNVITNQKTSDLFCRDIGVMFGNGQLWITEKKNKIGIHSVNMMTNE